MSSTIISQKRKRSKSARAIEYEEAINNRSAARRRTQETADSDDDSAEESDQISVWIEESNRRLEAIEESLGR